MTIVPLSIVLPGETTIRAFVRAWTVGVLSCRPSTTLERSDRSANAARGQAIQAKATATTVSALQAAQNRPRCVRGIVLLLFLEMGQPESERDHTGETRE